MSKPFNPNHLLDEAFVEMVNHELKSPLATIKISAEILQRRGPNLTDSYFKDSLTKINSRVDYLAALINDYTDLIRIETSRLIFKDEVCNFDDLILEFTNNFPKKFSNLTFKNYGAIGEKIVLDKDRLYQSLLGLIRFLEKSSNGCQNVRLYSELKDNFIVSNLWISKSKYKKEIDLLDPKNLTLEQSKIWQPISETKINTALADKIFKHYQGNFQALSNKKFETIFCFTLPVAH